MSWCPFLSHLLTWTSVFSLLQATKSPFQNPHVTVKCKVHHLFLKWWQRKKECTFPLSKETWSILLIVRQPTKPPTPATTPNTHTNTHTIKVKLESLFQSFLICHPDGQKLALKCTTKQYRYCYSPVHISHLVCGILTRRQPQVEISFR